MTPIESIDKSGAQQAPRIFGVLTSCSPGLLGACCRAQRKLCFDVVQLTCGILSSGQAENVRCIQLQNWLRCGQAVKGMHAPSLL